MSTTQEQLDSFIYPFDKTGRSSDNLIQDEKHVLQAPSTADFHFIIPRYAPFFQKSVVVRDQESGTVLEEGVDYWLTHKYIGASISLARPVYGSIYFFDMKRTGVVSIDYQTMGGKYLLDEKRIAEIIESTSRNPRVTAWEEISGLGEVFPPIDHDWNLQDMVGMSEVRASIDRIGDMIEAKTESGQNTAMSTLSASARSAAYDRRSAVGLGNVANLRRATRAQAIAGESHEAYMTPIRVKQFFEHVIGEKLYTQEEVDARLSEIENRLRQLES